MDSSADQTVIEPDLTLVVTQEQENNTPQSDVDSISKDSSELGSKITSTKSTVPPKRPTTTGAPKRPVTTASLATSTKPTISSTRVSIGSTLSKPPSRPMATSTAARRPPISSSSTPLAHRSRPSIASVEDLKTSSPGTVEAKRSMAAGTARRASLAPSGTTKPAISSGTTSISRRAPFVSSSDVKSSTSTSKPAVPSRASLLNTPRPIRSSTLTSSSSRLGAVQDGKKRLSTIPASPAAYAKLSIADSKQPQSEQKDSTMPTDLQQKLDQLLSVHNLRRKALTKDGNENDASKQEYIEAIDNILSHLGEKLKQTDILHGSSTKVEGPVAQDDTSTTLVPIDDNDSHNKMIKLEAEVADLRQKLAAATAQDSKASEVSDQVTSQLRDEHNGNLDDIAAKHEMDLRKLQVEFDQKNQVYEGQNQSLRDEHDKGLEELRNMHTNQLDQLQAELSNKDTLHQQNLDTVSKDLEEAKATALQQQSEATTTKLEALQKQLDHEQAKGSDTASENEELQTKLTNLQARLGEIEKNAARETTVKADLSKSVENKETAIRNKEEELVAAHDRIESLRADHALQLEKIQNENKDTQNRALELENSLNAITLEHRDNLAGKEIAIQEHLHKIQVLETSAVGNSEKHNQVISSKDAEIANINTEIESRDIAAVELASKHNDVITQKDNEIKSFRLQAEELKNQADIATDEKVKMSETKDLEINNLTDKIKALEEAASLSSDRLEEVSQAKDQEIASLHENANQLRTKISATSDEHNSLMVQKQEEFSTLQASTRETQTKSANKLEELAAARDAEITSLKDKIEELEVAAESVAKERDSIKMSLQESNDLIADNEALKWRVEDLKAALQDSENKASDSQASIEKTHQFHIGELNSKHASDLKNATIIMEKKHEKDIEGLESMHQNNIDTTLSTIKVEHASSLSSLQTKLDTSRENNQTMTNTISSLQTQLKNAEETLTVEKESIDSDRQELNQQFEDAKTESTALKKMLDTFDQESLDKDQAHAQSMQKIKSELETVSKVLTDKTQSLETGRADHADALEKLKMDHSDTINQLKIKSQDYQAKLKDADMKHAETVKGLEDEHTAKVEQQDMIQQQLKVKIAELSGSLNKLENSNNVQLQSHQSQMGEISHKLEAAQVAKDLAIASHDGKLARSRQAYEHKIAELNAQTKLAEEEHEKQRQSGAEVRDKLVDQLKELEYARQSVPRLQEDHSKLNQRLQLSSKEVHELRDSLDQALVELSEERARTDDLREEIQALHDELDTSTKDRNHIDIELQKAHNTAQAALVTQKSNNGILQQQLEDATSASMRHLARVREVEAALNAHSAEIFELKTRISGPQPLITAGLGNSRWADNGYGAGTDDGRDVGADLQGTMASIQAQLKALEAINIDMIDDHQRIVTNLLNRPTSSETGKTRSSQASTGVLSADAPAFSPGSL